MASSPGPGRSPDEAPDPLNSGQLPTRGARGRRRTGRLAVQILLLAVVIGLAVWANLYAADHDVARAAARRLGYPGILLASAFSGFNLVVPIPVVTFFPFFMEIGLRPLPTLLVIALGMSAGDLLGYAVGRTARRVVRPRDDGLLRRLESLRERRPRAPLLLMFLYAAFAPAPNEVLVLPLAFLRYPLGGIFAAVLLGNLIFNSIVAFGLIRMFELF